eukprot:gene4019-3931_t
MSIHLFNTWGRKLALWGGLALGLAQVGCAHPVVMEPQVVVSSRMGYPPVYGRVHVPGPVVHRGGRMEGATTNGMDTTAISMDMGAVMGVALRVKAATEARPLARFMVFNACTSEVLDFDLRGTPQEVLARLAVSHPAALACAASPADSTPPTDLAGAPGAETPSEDTSSAKTGPGRPKLGVVAREVTLLPRHWAWLSSQPGGASVALRKLVEQARKDSQSQDQRRLSQEATYRFMSAMAGCLEGFEEAARALFASDRPRFEALTAPWPQDIQIHLQHLAQAAWMPSDFRSREAAMPFIMLAVLLDMAAIGVIIPVLPALVGSFSGSQADQAYWYGVVAVAFGLSNFLAAPVLGALSDRYGRRPVLLLGFMGLGVSFFGTAMST